MRFIGHRSDRYRDARVGVDAPEDHAAIERHNVAVFEHADAPNIHAHRGVELERVAAGRGFRVAEHDADLHANLIDENDHRHGSGNRRS